MLQAGYRIGERIIRPARVAVAEPSPEPSRRAARIRRPPRLTVRPTTDTLCAAGPYVATSDGAAPQRRIDASREEADSHEHTGLRGEGLLQGLGVPKDATTADIKKAYRKLARELHPDANKGDAKAEEQFKEVSEAYDVLSDDKREGVRRGPQPVRLRRHAPAPAATTARATASTSATSSTASRPARNGGLGDVFGGLFNRGGRPAPAAPRRGRRDRGHARASRRRWTVPPSRCG